MFPQHKQQTHVISILNTGYVHINDVKWIKKVTVKNKII